MNTLKSGKVRYIVFQDIKEPKIWYGAALEFNIVVHGDNPTMATLELFDAMHGYVETLRKVKGLRDFYPLNQEADPEYESMWNKISGVQKAKEKVKSPFIVNNYGFSNI